MFFEIRSSLETLQFADSLVPECIDLTHGLYDDAGRYSVYLSDFHKQHEVPPSFEQFNTVVFQAYQDGNAGTGWHDDHQIAGGWPQCILSIGATRTFAVRPYKGMPGRSEVYPDDELAMMFDVEHGDVTWIAPQFHERFQHSIEPDPSVTAERWSFVFRNPA